MDTNGFTHVTHCGVDAVGVVFGAEGQLLSGVKPDSLVGEEVLALG